LVNWTTFGYRIEYVNSRFSLRKVYHEPEKKEYTEELVKCSEDIESDLNFNHGKSNIDFVTMVLEFI
jgi:hypothetical protein